MQLPGHMQAPYASEKQIYDSGVGLEAQRDRINSSILPTPHHQIRIRSPIRNFLPKRWPCMQSHKQDLLNQPILAAASLQHETMILYSVHARPGPGIELYSPIPGCVG
jgi:uncharacterized protein involved in exopolysaccharide biosynthesis